ncbi:ArsR/SmtB family transcription factor [Acetobacter ascendens]|uniref:Transcriptional regulator n=1 Tax=Acetobacter ascendens TaxID=481146 RepID=A0A1D8QSU6_9PROT|nr:metalloregulator ArsR/SmtB family transcription factor [Acetobacter ascendens]AOW45405.1 transcriptional regulator [Acetobacter ascendens]AOW48935.1 transcriptional regulator [Acetobacter ascendens]
MVEMSLDEAKQLVEQLKLFAQPQRLMILDALLRHGALAVGELESKTRIGQPTLSQQLGTLRRSNLIVPRRESRTIYYSLQSEDEALRVRILIGLLKGDKGLLSATHEIADKLGTKSTKRKDQILREEGAQFAFVQTIQPPRRF